MLYSIMIKEVYQIPRMEESIDTVGSEYIQ